MAHNQRQLTWKLCAYLPVILFICSCSSNRETTKSTPEPTTQPIAVVDSAAELNAISVVSQDPDPKKTTEQFILRHQEAIKNNPPDVQFRIQLANGNISVRRGEPIELDLIFSSSSPRKYQVYPNITLMPFFHMDHFFVDPKDGAVDPLYDYHHLQHMGGMGGGISSIVILNETVETIELPINDRIRFDKTGMYRLYLTTDRLHDLSARNSQNTTIKNVTVTSNITEFEVLPMIHWTEKQIKDASNVQLLARGTKEAVLELIHRYSGSDIYNTNEIFQGLAASPYREFVVQQMENVLLDPAKGITRTFIRTLAIFAYSVPANLPPVVPGYDPPLDMVTHNKQSVEIEKLLIEYMVQLHDALESKSGEAKAISANALLEEVRSLRRSSSLKIPEQLTSYEKILVDDFEKLPHMDQLRYLRNDYQWEEIAGPEMLPVLRRLYQNSPRTNDTRRSPDDSIATPALVRIYELAPDEGRELILAEIASLHPRADMSVLGSLPDQTLPDVEETLFDNLKIQMKGWAQNKDAILTAHLIQRYATPELFPKLKAFYEESLLNTESSLQAPLLAYFLRVQPDYGVERVRMCTIPESSRFHDSIATLLNKVGALHPDPVLEELAIPLLANSETVDIFRVCQILSDYGTEKSEAALLDRYMKWYETWKDRADELNKSVNAGPEISNAIHIERALFEALTEAKGWYWDAERLEQFRPYCLSGYTKERLKVLIERRQTSPEINVRSETLNTLQFSIAGITTSDLNVVMEKLAQFPPEKTIRWNVMKGVKPELERSAYDTLKPFCDERHLILER